MAETSFEVLYDGPGLRSGEMPVRHLAPALLALGDVFTAASLALYPDREPVALNIKATREGSFKVQLVLDAREWKQVVDFFSGDLMTAVVNLKEVIFGGGFLTWSVFKLIKKIAGRGEVGREETPDGNVRLSLFDGTTIEGVPSDVMRVYDHVGLRESIRDVVAPVQSPGIDHFEVTDDGKTRVAVETAEVEWFDVSYVDGDAQAITETVLPNALLTVLKPSFSDQRWRLTLGAPDEGFWASVTDQSFLARVAAGEAFQAGDTLRGDLRMVQSEGPSGRLKIERSIDKVTDHMRQLQLGDANPKRLIAGHENPHAEDSESGS